MPTVVLLITTPGSGTFTWPDGVNSLLVELWGGGGSGGGATGTVSAGGGGAGGKYTKRTVFRSGLGVWRPELTLDDYSVAAAQSNGQGNSTWFRGNGYTVSGSDASGMRCDGGLAGGLASSNSSNGSGGPAASDHDDIFYGGSGTAGVFSTTTGGAGGGGAGSQNNGSNAVGATAGAGGVPEGGIGGAGVAPGNAGLSGTAPGGGGSGGNANDATDRAGGPGAAGQIRITYQTKDISVFLRLYGEAPMSIGGIG